MDVLAYLSSSIHLYCLALEFRKLELDRSTGVGRGNLELEPELISYKIVSTGADTLPLGSIFRWFNLEPIIVLQFVGLDIGDDSFELLFVPVLPLFVLRSCVNRQEGNLGGSLLD